MSRIKHGRHLKPCKHERAYRIQRAHDRAEAYYSAIAQANARRDEQARRANWTGPELDDTPPADAFSTSGMFDSEVY